MTERGPIFVLGDSRTGTTSLHKYFRDAGLRSIHYYNKESGMELPIPAHIEKNTPRLLEFIRTSGFEAFSDYPTRLFWRQLYDAFPSASFILSVRQSTDIWERSMLSYFPARGVAIDITSLRGAYERVNSRVMALFDGGDRRFLRLCIDDDAGENAGRLAEFLGMPGSVRLGRHNASGAA